MKRILYPLVGLLVAGFLVTTGIIVTIKLSTPPEVTATIRIVSTPTVLPYPGPGITPTFFRPTTRVVNTVCGWLGDNIDQLRAMVESNGFQLVDKVTVPIPPEGAKINRDIEVPEVGFSGTYRTTLYPKYQKDLVFACGINFDNGQWGLVPLFYTGPTDVFGTMTITTIHVEGTPNTTIPIHGDPIIVPAEPETQS